MKKLSILFMSFVALTSATFTSCSKNDNSTPAATTALELVIQDENELVAIQGASVKLYATDADRKAGTNQIGATQTSDSSGKVKFDNLSAQVYYYTATKADGCLSNAYSITTTYDATTMKQAPLVAGKVNSMKVPLLGLGTMTLTNNSSTDVYNVYLRATTATNDGTYTNVGKLAGSDGKVQLSLPNGSFDAKFVKLAADGVTEVAGSDILKPALVITACGTTDVTFP